jgi:hypothetical protein
MDIEQRYDRRAMGRDLYPLQLANSKLTFDANVQNSICKLQIRMTRHQVLDLYFLDARHKLIEIAAFLDRVERADGPDDFRLAAFREALGKLSADGKHRVKNALLAFSDHSTELVDQAPGKGAVGAAPG